MSRKVIALILSIDEAKDLLAESYVEIFATDKTYTFELVRNGELDSIPKINKMVHRELANMVGELNVAETLAVKNKVDQVYVDICDTTADEEFILVWDKENLDPRDRRRLKI